MLTGDVCNREVVVCTRDTSIFEAAGLMRAHHVGDLVVVDEQAGRRRPAGILTDRDIVLEIIAEGVDLREVAVGDVMSGELVTARADEEISDTLQRMRAKGVRRLPVVDADGTLVGILTVDDLLDLLGEQVSDLTRLIRREQAREQDRRG